MAYYMKKGDPAAVIKLLKDELRLMHVFQKVPCGASPPPLCFVEQATIVALPPFLFLLFFFSLLPLLLPCPPLLYL